MTRYKLSFECISPIFIGGTEELSYLNIFFNNKNDQRAMLKIFPELTPPNIQERLLPYLTFPNSLQLHQIYESLISEEPKLPVKTIADSTDFELKERYEKNITSINIKLMPSRNDSPYVPGSSLKGMFKTPFIKEEPRPYNLDGSAKDFNNDPFRLVRFTDSLNEKLKLHAGNIEVKNFSTRNPNSIPGYFQYLAPGSTFESEITDMGDKIDFNQVSLFYLYAYKKNKEQIYRQDIDMKDFCNSFETRLMSMNNNQFIASLGGMGGAWTKVIGDTFKFNSEKFYRTSKSSFRKSNHFKQPMGWIIGTYERL